MPKAKITLVGSDAATVEPLVIRPGETTQLVFKAQLVNNKGDENRPVKGALVWQRRSTSEKGHEWADEATLKLSTMTAGSGIKLELNTEELHLLTQIVRGLYGVYWRNGKKLPASGDEFDLADYAQAAKSLDTLDSAAQVIEKVGQDGFVSILTWLADRKNSLAVLDALPKLGLADLTEINSLAGIGMLKQALAVWNANKANPDESFWQATLQKYSFVFSQVFSAPVVVFGTKVYVGGKDLEGSGGKEPDFLLKNELTNYALIVEIKTPETPLLGASAYRPPDVFAAHRELCGAVGQIGRYKDEFLHNYSEMYRKTEGKFLLADPRCLVVIGSTGQLDSTAKKGSFEYFRRGQRGTEIITFDELFRKVDVLLRLLQGTT
jgi:hypothetical protein